MTKFLEGNVVKILTGQYKGRNGLISQVKKDKVLVTVDPFGKQLWFKREDLE